MSFRVLFNDCYGGFAVSEAFDAEYTKRTGKSFGGDLYILGARRDPVALDLFDERGSEWCSGPNSMLAVHEIPNTFEKYWEIDEFDGSETVRLLISEAFVDVLETYLETDDRAAMIKQYHAICAAAGRNAVTTNLNIGSVG